MFLVESVLWLVRNTGTKDPDSLFFGITNPDFIPNLESLGLIEGGVECRLSGAIEVSIFVAILFLKTNFPLSDSIERIESDMTWWKEELVLNIDSLKHGDNTVDT